MTKNVSTKSIFGEYSKDEDRVTTALLQILHYGGHDVVSRVFEELDLPSNTINVYPQVVEADSRPDGEISCDCHYHIYIESKIKANVMGNNHEMEQLSNNRKLISNGSGRYLIYLTPDKEIPKELVGIAVTWLNWEEIISRLEGITASNDLLPFLIRQFKLLVEHLVYKKGLNDSGIFLSEEERESAKNRVIVVGGSFGEPVALKYGFYACQEGRFFLKSSYLAFCYKNRIQYLFKILDDPKESTDLRQEGIDPQYFQDFDPNYSGDARKYFKLEQIEEFNPVIVNDTLDKNGKRCAFVQKQTYTTFEKITNAIKTSDLL